MAAPTGPARQQPEHPADNFARPSHHRCYSNKPLVPTVLKPDTIMATPPFTGPPCAV